MNKLLSHLYGAIQILINPNYLRSRVDRINSHKELPTGIEIVAKSVYNELDAIVERYPNDKGLRVFVAELKLEAPEDKDELKHLIQKRQEVESMPVKRCPLTGENFLFTAPSHDIKKDN